MPTRTFRASTMMVWIKTETFFVTRDRSLEAQVSDLLERMLTKQAERVKWAPASIGPWRQLGPGVNWTLASSGPRRQVGPRVWTAGWNGLRTPMPVLRSTHIQCRMGMGHSSRRLNGSDVSTANRGGNRMDNRQILREISKRISAPYQRQKLSSAPR